MKTIELIYAHRVQFNYFSRSKNAIPNDSEIEHVTGLIVEGCTSGQLIMDFVGENNQNYEFLGWWKILN
jgi:hypothetical protein